MRSGERSAEPSVGERFSQGQVSSAVEGCLNSSPDLAGAMTCALPRVDASNKSVQRRAVRAVRPCCRRRRSRPKRRSAKARPPRSRARTRSIHSAESFEPSEWPEPRRGTVRGVTPNGHHQPPHPRHQSQPSRRTRHNNHGNRPRRTRPGNLANITADEVIAPGRRSSPRSTPRSTPSLRRVRSVSSTDASRLRRRSRSRNAAASPPYNSTTRPRGRTRSSSRSYSRRRAKKLVDSYRLPFSVIPSRGRFRRSRGSSTRCACSSTN